LLGGGNGYGEGIARRFAQEGARVLIADLNDEGAKRVSTFMPDTMSYTKADVAKREDREKIMDTALSRYGRIDCLVNNAGTTHPNKVGLHMHP